MQKHWLLSFGTLTAIVIGAITAFTVLGRDDRSEGPHYHAGFQVYVNNELQDFSDLKYMKMNPCGDHHVENLSPEEEQLEKAHLHDLNGDVAHMHRDNVTWGDLFTNMTYDLPEGEREAYVNGEKIEGDILDQVIRANDSVVILVGDSSDAEAKLEDAVTLDRIREVEALSENCGVK